jgi:hypothetical protein
LIVHETTLSNSWFSITVSSVAATAVCDTLGGKTLLETTRKTGLGRNHPRGTQLQAGLGQRGTILAGSNMCVKVTFFS